MYVLTVDTSTPQVATGIVEVAESGAFPRSLRTIARECHMDARAHNEVLIPLILQCLKSAQLTPKDLGAVVVGCGPGPFTGLRVGMATAASFAAALGIPCHGVNSHDALYEDSLSDEHLRSDASCGTVAVTDARRREVYFTAYRAGTTIFGPAVAKAADVAQLIAQKAPEFEPVLLLGSEKHCRDVVESTSAHLWAEPIAATEDTHGTNMPATTGTRRIVSHYPTPSGLARAAGFGLGEVDQNPRPLTPLYLRRPDAVPPKAKPQSPAVPVIDVENL